MLLPLHAVSLPCCAQELWCKKASPSLALTGDYIPQPRIPLNPPDPPPRPDPQREATLVAAADAMGALLQYNTQGFIVNQRQRRMGGLAAIELAQNLQHLVRRLCPVLAHATQALIAVRDLNLNLLQAGLHQFLGQVVGCMLQRGSMPC